ncbi:hypothetical protein V6Z12_D05G433200 [Gossypium hirsutum]
MSCCDPNSIARDLIGCGEMKGIRIDPPFDY